MLTAGLAVLVFSGVVALGGLEVVAPVTFLVFVAIALGAAQSGQWHFRFAKNAYRLDGETLSVLRSGEVVQSWTRREVDGLRLEDRVTWGSLFSRYAWFPQLVVRSNGTVTTCPRVLSWGTEDADVFEQTLRTWLRG